MTPLSDELDALEKSIRQLHTEWEKFFGGIERKPPNDLETRVKNHIKKFAYGDIRNPTDRFRYQTLTARYNTFAELWNKRLRAIEEGKPFGVHGLKADILPPLASRDALEALRETIKPAPTAAPGPEVRIRAPEAESEAVKTLYERFVAERQRAGESGTVKFDSFQKLIAQQASRIISEKGARAVDFRFETKDGKVSLKARPVK